jgi:hypothetical protein
MMTATAGRTISPDMGCTGRSRSPHQADDDTGAGKRWWLAAFLFLGRSRCERAAVAHVVPGGLDPAVGALDMRDAERVDLTVEGIGDAAHMPSDTEES